MIYLSTACKPQKTLENQGGRPMRSLRSNWLWYGHQTPVANLSYSQLKLMTLITALHCMLFEICFKDSPVCSETLCLVGVHALAPERISLLWCHHFDTSGMGYIDLI